MSSTRQNQLVRPVLLLLTLFCCCLPPLGGILLRGEDIHPFLEFPPRPTLVAPESFSPALFTAALALVLATVLLGILFLRCPRLSPQPSLPSRRHALPWWFFGGLLLLMISWILAWTRFSWFTSLQHLTFTPLWLGYILVVSGLCHYRTGQSMFSRQPRLLWSLPPASALFWWYFEYINRFVHNWVYVNVQKFPPLKYITHATLSFATVLPAVLITREFLLSFPGMHRRLPVLKQPYLVNGRLGGMLLLGISMSGLTGLAFWPEQLFPLVWIAPLIVICGLELFFSLPTIFAKPVRHTLPATAFAALICGFFWEMWNWRSLAHWEYTLPYVNRFHIFAMPLPGYLGYLPFGLECLAVSLLIPGIDATRLNYLHDPEPCRICRAH